MFKISLLSSTAGKPYGSPDSGGSGHSKRNKQQTATATARSDKTSLSAALEPRNWSQQAADITDNLLDVSKYKSLAVYAEVKLAEALDRAAKVQPDTVNEDGELLPNSLKTAVCFQLLGELAELCGPFSKTLTALRDQLLPAVYSSYAAAEAAKPLQFDQMPWFSVAAHLQRDNTALLAQQEAFKRELAHHQAQMAAVEQQLLTFKAAIDAGEVAAAALTATNATLAAARDAAVDEASAAAEENRRLATDVARLKDALLEVQSQLDISKDNAAQDKEEWTANLAVLKKQIVIEQQEKEAAVGMAAARVTTEAEMQDLQERCAEAELKLEQAEQHLAAAASSASQESSLTPRPHWGPDQDLADKCKSTAETVRQLQQQHLETVTALQRKITLSKALSQPDPAPQPWTLSLRTETLNYFITEGALNPTGITDSEGLDTDLDGSTNPTSKPQLFAEGLGLGSRVPRFLRWDQPVEIQEVDLDQLQQQVQEISSSKVRFEAEHGQCSLQEYLYHHFTAAAAAQPSSSTDGDTTESAAAAAAVAGYSFYHACSSHRRHSVLVETIWHVLIGQLPESILAEQQQQVAAVGQLLKELASAAAAATAGGNSSEAERPGVSLADISSAMRFLYPFKPQEQVTDLTACVAAACGIGTSSSGGSRRGTSDKGSSVSEPFLQQLASTVQAASQGVLLTPGAVTSGSNLQQYEQQATASELDSPAAAAAAELVECLLHQHLQAVLSFTQEVVQHVQGVLVHRDAGSTDGGSSSGQHSDAAWLEVTEYLQQVLSLNSSSRQTRSLEPGGNAAGKDSSISDGRNTGSVRLRPGNTEDMPLLAAAAAAAGANHRSDSNAAKGSFRSSTQISTASSVVHWLQAAQQIYQLQGQSTEQAVDVSQTVRWLQRECLMQPASCLPDIGAAVQWCRSALKGRVVAADGDAG